MTPHTYAPGDLVKIISMEEVRKYPLNSNGDRPIGGPVWQPGMDIFAGTIQQIESVMEYNGKVFYELKNDLLEWSFSPEMISGPAEAPQVPDREKYAERLERFVLAVAAGQGVPDFPKNDKPVAASVVAYSVELLAAFDEEVKKYKV